MATGSKELLTAKGQYWKFGSSLKTEPSSSLACLNPWNALFDETNANYASRLLFYVNAMIVQS